MILTPGTPSIPGIKLSLSPFPFKNARELLQHSDHGVCVVHPPMAFGTRCLMAVIVCELPSNLEKPVVSALQI